MELKLYEVVDGDNVINKTKVLKTSLSINLKRDVDISSPILMLSTDSPTGFSGINYAEIVEFNRYYFVTSVKNLSNKIWELQLSCDVLETYKADILASNARLTRNLKAGDYLDVGIEKSHSATITKYYGDVSVSMTETMVLTTVGDK